MTEITILSALEKYILKHQEEQRKKPYFTGEGKVFSLNDILTEIRNNTDMARDIEKQLIMLTIDLIVREKKNYKISMMYILYAN